MSSAWIRITCAAILLTTAIIRLEAGGWVVITVGDFPDYVVAGQSVTLTYGVRQHGRHLLDGLAGRIEARQGTHLIRVAAAAAPERGYYSATLTLPHAGDWTIDILSGFSGGLQSSRVALHAIAEGQTAPEVTEADRGRRLFVAKGCGTCHVHAAVEGRSTSAGATLTTKRYEPEFLARFLAHAPAREPYVAGEWQMPDLKLRDREIASLVAFLNAGSAPASQR